MKDFGLNSSMNRLAMRGLMGGTHGCTMNLFIILTLEEEVAVFEEELQKGDNLGYEHLGPFGSEGSCVMNFLYEVLGVFKVMLRLSHQWAYDAYQLFSHPICDRPPAGKYGS